MISRKWLRSDVTVSSRLIALFTRNFVYMNFPTTPTQRDDIEYAIAQYVEGMNPALFQLLAGGRKEFLLEHTRFEEDMREAQEKLEGMM